MCNPVVALSRIADAIAVLFVRPRVYLYRARTGKRATMKRCLMRTKEIFDLAVCAGYVHHNPINGLSRLFKPPKN